ncbi:MAG: heparinase II/III-family protein [Verrucomicrobia bacterium]|nr:heparinase II/III-family protein [Verrucomicrobiota bacterium]MCG2681261.1 heparinase II/III-family protein [Kiritimatiellia bacterium]MBU4246929.1 heparinase II/III-family protein [Verrucomicrobiota bacterium]MBU4291597.1 heparinase II/III-family protein [Verrucomicrobiota bacterium]MBU4428316.1 heparinase II/III-family protein [Verrucomicrobiota bacterium]
MKLKTISLPLFLALSLGGQEPATTKPKENNIMEISSYLDTKPVGPGIRISDREKWDKLEGVESYMNILKKAGDLLKEPMPKTSDELYLDFTKTGIRSNWEKVNFGSRRSRIKTFTVAECLENKGGFIPAIEEAVSDICKEKTWVMPAHDRGLGNFNGKITEIDLGSSMFALDLATSYFVLGDKLSRGCRTMIEENISRRILIPYKDMVTGKQPMNWWLKAENNWNAVCLGCVTAAGLTMLESKEDRAWFISEALKYSKYYLAGFTEDGYCSEGLDYWSYGFSYYVILAESILKATHGEINLFDDEKTKVISEFPSKIEIMNGVSPAFADCGVKAKPLASLVKHISSRYGKTSGVYNNLVIDIALFYCLAVSFPEKAEPPIFTERGNSDLRTWFNNAGILICRPAKDSSCKIGVALKGGHNGEQHNHNDVGSYVVVMGKEPVVLDPGSETYTARTFSDRRYESNFLNSFGHSVPVVGGQLQKTGADARAKILKTDFTDDCDAFAMDIASAYAVNELQSLKRTFVYSRKGDGSLTVTDEVSFSKPMSFETAVITLGTFEKKSDSALIISSGKEKLLAEFSTDGGAIEIISGEIGETHGNIKPLRIGFKLKIPVEKATITVIYSPL